MQLWLGTLCAVMLMALPSFAQPVPDNASAKSYGDGWECDIGYRQREDLCAAVVVPENAYATNRSYGRGWACLHGFLERDRTSCVAVVVPEGAFLDPSGERWHCLRGFARRDGACVEVIVPENALDRKSVV